MHNAPVLIVWVRIVGRPIQKSLERLECRPYKVYFRRLVLQHIYNDVSAITFGATGEAYRSTK